MNLSEQLEAKRSELASLLALAQTEERKLTEEEQSTFDSLEVEVRELKENIDAEVAEREAKEAEDAIKSDVKRELDVAIRALSLIDAEAELNKAYIELDKAWSNYYESIEKANEEARKDEIRNLIAEVLASPTARNQELVLAEEISARAAEVEAERASKITDLESQLTAERESKAALQIKLDEQERSDEQNNKNEMELFDSIRGVESGAATTLNVAERAAVDGDTSVLQNVIPKGVKDLSVLGKDPIWMQMGVDYMPNATGTYTLPFENPIVGAKLAELASITGDIVTPSGTLVTPKRFSVDKTFTLESINSATDNYLSRNLANLIAGCDRAITKEVFAKAVAGAGEVAAVTSLTKANFELLMKSAEGGDNGAFLSEKSEFYSALDVKVDEGSGRFLTTFLSGSEGRKGVTNHGVPYWYSELFTNATKVVVYGDISKIHVADYNNIEVIVDKFTKAKTGQVVITVNKIADVALLNPAAFSKSATIV